MCRGSGPTCSGKMKACEAGKDACVVIVGESSTSTSRAWRHTWGGGCAFKGRRQLHARGGVITVLMWEVREEGKTILGW